MIELQNVTKDFGEGEGQIHAVHDISLTIEDGEIFGIIGLSGAGKSTLVRCINLLERPTSGSVIVDGKDLTKLPQKELLLIRRSIGMIFQGFNLLAQRTVLQNVCYPLEIAGWKKKESVERAMELLSVVGLADRAKAYPSQLSGGQKQRVAIAGVLAMEPKVLILDDPAAGLDPRGRERILGMLQELHREGGVTIVMVSHSMDDCARLATRMIVMSKGELVLTDTPRNVFRQADLMRSIGLGVPEAAELCSRLRAAGLQLPDDLFTQEELHDHLLRLWKEKQEKEAAK